MTTLIPVIIAAATSIFGATISVVVALRTAKRASMLHYLQAILSNSYHATHLRKITYRCEVIINVLSLFGAYNITKEAVLALENSNDTTARLLEILGFCAAQSNTLINDKMSRARDLDREIWNSKTITEYIYSTDVLSFLKQTWTDDSLKDRELVSRFIEKEKNRLLSLRAAGPQRPLFGGAPRCFKRIQEGMDKIATNDPKAARDGAQEILDAIQDFLQCKHWY